MLTDDVLVKRIQQRIRFFIVANRVRGIPKSLRYTLGILREGNHSYAELFPAGCPSSTRTQFFLSETIQIVQRWILRCVRKSNSISLRE